MSSLIKIPFYRFPLLLLLVELDDLDAPELLPLDLDAPELPLEDLLTELLLLELELEGRL